MALASGTRLGRYEIVSVIGVGGMGEVYRARDAKLERDAALKVLPEQFADDAERLSRFEREARVLGALNHSNIAHIYGLEESSGVRALAMELVDGLTLADRIAQGPLSVEETRAIAMQIAAAVEAAHEAGVIHRDLKPANIKVRRDGTVKVLDFGLAKAITRVDSSRSVTTAAGYGAGEATGPGIVLGTAAYMAPEQARGQDVDKRADIWAFGCILYEMVTGRRLFDGATMSDIIAAVLTRDIDLAELPATVPANWRTLLSRCLDRDARTRLRDIGEARVALALSEPAVSSDAGRAVPGRGGPVSSWAAIAILAAAAGAALMYWLQPARPASENAPSYRFQVTTPTMLNLTEFDLSPDGRTLAFVALAENQVPAVWIRPLDAADASVLTGTEGARGVFWSPDSRSVAYVANRGLYTRPLQGGPPHVVARFSGQFIGGAWADDTIVFSVFPAGLMRVAASGGDPSALTRLRSGDRLHGRPVFLPGGRRMLFPASTATGEETCTVSIDDPSLRCVQTDGAVVAGIDADRILSVRGGSLLVEGLDAHAMRTTGNPASAVADELHLRAAGNRAAVSYSRGGVLAFRPGAAEQRRLLWIDRGGRPGNIVSTGNHENFDLGPDDTRVLAAGTDGRGNNIVSLIDLARGVVSRVVAGELAWANDPVFSPDGRQFAYMQRSDHSRIVVRPVDGGAERTVYESADEDVWVEDWSQDDRFLAVGSSKGWRQPRVLLVPLAGGPPVTVPAEGGIIDEFHFSPDNKWLAYNSDASGRQEVYVMPLPPTGERWQVSSDGGVQPRWRRDGRELYYIAPASTMMSVAIGVGRSFQASAPKRLFALPEGLDSPIMDQYAVARDGQSFLVAEPIRGRGVQPITVIVNWRPPIP